MLYASVATTGTPARHTFKTLVIMGGAANLCRGRRLATKLSKQIRSDVLHEIGVCAPSREVVTECGET